MHPLLTYFLGGFSILLFGFYTTARALESLTTIRLAGILKKSTAKPYQAFLIGILFGFFMQSGSATTALLLGFVSAGLLDLTKALYVVSGAAVGATFMLQIVAFKITDYAFLLIFLGVILLVLIPSRKFKLIGQVLVGFGLVFYGLHLLLEAGNIIQGSPELLALIRSSAQNSKKSQIIVLAKKEASPNASNWRRRHSFKFLAPTPGGSNVWIIFKTFSTSSSVTFNS